MVVDRWVTGAPPAMPAGAPVLGSNPFAVQSIWASAMVAAQSRGPSNSGDGAGGGVPAVGGVDRRGRIAGGCRGRNRVAIAKG